MRTIVSVIFCIAIAVTASAADFAAGNWTSESVARFVYNVTGGEYVEGTAQGFRFIDLDGNTAPELVTWIDISGRGHGRLFVIAQTTNGGYRHDSVPASYVTFDDVLRDIDADGKPEVLLRKLLTPYGGGHARAEVTTIYAFGASGLRDVSREHAAFFQNSELPRVESALSRARHRTGEGDIAVADALIVERDKILRLLDRDASAGLDVAEAWTLDPLARRRTWAAVVLGDIDAPKCEQLLAMLAEDRDRGVAEAAKQALERRAEREKSPRSR